MVDKCPHYVGVASLFVFRGIFEDTSGADKLLSLHYNVIYNY